MNIEAMLNELKKPLKQRVAERLTPQNTDAMSTLGFCHNGNGISANPAGDLQMGGEGANIICLPENSAVAISSSETQIHGQLKLFPSSQSTVLDINMGPLNPKLIPPKDTAGRFTPPYALMTVGNRNPLPTNTVIVDVKPVGTPGPEGMPTVPWVKIPNHVHPDPISGVTGTVIEWGDGCLVPLHGVTYQSLFGYNHLVEHVTKAIAKLMSLGI